MSYTPPLGNAVDVSWLGEPSYAPPLGDAADAAWPANAFEAVIAGAIATGAFAITGSATGSAGVASVTAATATGAIPFATTLTGTATAQHPRYEVRGQVRLAGVAVERRVRAYGRDVGELLGQGDTTGGFFRIPAGFAEIECTVLPIDLATDATDYEPPTANRVLCVLAEDDA